MPTDRKARLLAEIKQYSPECQAVQLDDITLEDIMQERKIGKRWAQDILRTMAQQHPDKYKRVLVRISGVSHPVYVLRPIDRYNDLAE